MIRLPEATTGAGMHNGQAKRANISYFVVLTLFVASCANKPGTEVVDAADPSTTATTTTAVLDPAMTPGELKDFLRSLNSLPDRWNGSQLRWGLALRDPNVSFEAFGVTQREVGLAQGKLLIEMELWFESLSPDLQSAARPLLDNYQQRLSLLLDEVFPAALSGNDAAFQAAGQRYVDLTSVESMEPVIRSAFSTPGLAAAIEAEGGDVEDTIAAILRTIGG